MSCPYCLQNHAGDCPRDPNLAARQAREAAAQAQASALQAVAAASVAQDQASLAVTAAATATTSTEQAAAVWASEGLEYERTHPGGKNRRVGLPSRRVGFRDDWIRWGNPERRIGVYERRQHG